MPVCENIDVLAGTVLPLCIIQHFIREACRRVILSERICRRVNGCRDYHRGIGCIFLGEAATGIDPEIGVHVATEEALERARRSLRAGLIPVIGHAALETFALGVKPHTRMVSICQCCPCCRMMATFPRAGPWARGFFPHTGRRFGRGSG